MGVQVRVGQGQPATEFGVERDVVHPGRVVVPERAQADVADVEGGNRDRGGAR